MRPLDKVLAAATIAFLALSFTNHQGGSPAPGPGPGPTPVGSEKALICYETSPASTYTTQQILALNSARAGSIQTWAKANCAADGYHCFDQDTDVSKLDKFWKDALAAAKEKPQPNVSTWNGRRWTVKQRLFSNPSDLRKAIGAPSQ